MTGSQDIDPRSARIDLLYTLAPLLALNTLLFAARILGRIELLVPRPDQMHLQDWLDLSASFFFFNLGVALFSIGLLRCGARRAPAIWLLRALVLVIGLAEIVGHVYFMISGDSLDFFQLVYVLQRPRDLLLIALARPAETRWFAAIGLFVALLLAAPRLHRRLARATAPVPSRPGIPRPAAWLLLAGSLPTAALGALVFADPRVDAMLLRDPALNLAATLGASWMQDPASIAKQLQGLRPFERRIVRLHARRPANVVIVVLESTRAIGTTPYAPKLATTPFLADLSRHSLFVEHAYSVITRTPKALVAVLCGLEPSHSVEPKSAVLGLLYGCLPALLADQGYATVYLQSADPRLDDRIQTAYEMGFRQFIAPSARDTKGFEQPNVLGTEDDALLAPTRRWLAAHPQGPFLATYLTVNAHYHCQPLTRHGFVSFDGDAEVNCYDNAIRADDFFLRALFDVYQEAGRFDDTLFVVIGDHGEAFYEHGLGGHNNVPYDETLRIPFLIHDPSGVRVPPRRISEPRTGAAARSSSTWAAIPASASTWPTSIPTASPAPTSRSSPGMTGWSGSTRSRRSERNTAEGGGSGDCPFRPLLRYMYPVRVLLQHRSRYRYPRPAVLGPHLIRLRPAAHAKAHVETYSLRVTAPGDLRWQQDPSGNHVARATWASPVPELEVAVELAVDIRPVNPFDFTLDAYADDSPFEYGPLASDLAAYLDRTDPAFACGPLADAFFGTLPQKGRTVPLVVEFNRLVHEKIRYVIREEAGVWTPEETLRHGRGSCRDSAVLLVAALRSRGLAARFVSGYLVQLTDEGMLPDQPKGVSRDVVDLHAWAEVFLPGGGWIGLDATSGLLCGEGHIPLACTALPLLAAPVEGASDIGAEGVDFEMRIGRLGHEVRPTAPFTEETWESLCAAGAATDAKLSALGVALTCGGEPTFNSRLHTERPEWNTDALGTTKWEQGLSLSRELQQRLCPGGILLLRQGKHYPGESLPRWTLALIGRKDSAPLWTQETDAAWPQQPGLAQGATDARLVPAAQKLCEAIAAALGVAGFVHEASEDPWRHLQDEASLPVEQDPLLADLRDPEERRRLARVLDRGLATPAGFVLPLAAREGVFVSERWSFRRGRLFLLPGDSPMGLRLPLASLGGAAPPFVAEEEPFAPLDPRGPEAAAQAQEQEEQRRARKEREAPPGAPLAPPRKQKLPPPKSEAVRTALCVEPRGGVLCVFLPPLPSANDFLRLIAVIDQARAAAGAPVLLEGYPPARNPGLVELSVAPDPGVLEVNLPPTASFAEHAALVETVFEAALKVGLSAEKYLLDGRQAGSGGGNHITVGGPKPLVSPFVRDPRLLASLLTFVQHHPSLSYLFSGLFVGPTSQAPRLDEARHDALYEMEIALARAFDGDKEGAPPPPWLSDQLFRNLLVDVTGNTHRAEICIDKLFDWRTPHGRQGLVELRAFEMPPHPRMMVAQTELVRALIAAFAQEPYRAPLVRWGQELHDRFLLPTWMWRDFEDVLAFLEERGLPHPAEAYRAFLELRCPVAGQLQAGPVLLEVRNALEPWNVLGEEPSGGGTSRYVDSSVERIEVRCEGLVPGRHQILVNGYQLPLRPTGRAGEGAAGVRFRAWAPPHSLHAHLGIHHPIRLDVVDAWARRSLGACAYHVWHPEGRAYDAQPLTRFESASRRAQRFTTEGALPWPVAAAPAAQHPDAPWTLDLRRLPLDRPPPPPDGHS